MQTREATTFVHPSHPIIAPPRQMTRRRPWRSGRFSDERRRAHEAEERWREAGYGDAVIEKLEWDRRYSVLRVAGLELAYSDYKRFTAALAAAWDAGYVPGPGHSSVCGVDLPDVAPSLSGVDVDLASQDLLRPRHSSR